MFDIITLSLLWFFTAGVSGIAYVVKLWDGGIYWFWAWNCVALAIGAWELYLYLKYRMTLTRTLTKAGTGQPLAAKHKVTAYVIVICYLLGIISLCVHLWPWK